MIREALKLVLLLEQANFHYMASLAAGMSLCCLLVCVSIGLEVWIGYVLEAFDAPPLRFIPPTYNSTSVVGRLSCNLSSRFSRVFHDHRRGLVHDSWMSPAVQLMHIPHMTTQPGTKIARLMTVFVAGAEIFRDDEVHAMLQVLLLLYARSGAIDFSNVPGISFLDLFTAFVYQVRACASQGALHHPWVLGWVS